MRSDGDKRVKNVSVRVLSLDKCHNLFVNFMQWNAVKISGIVGTTVTKIEKKKKTSNKGACKTGLYSIHFTEDCPWGFFIPRTEEGYIVNFPCKPCSQQISQLSF